MASFNIAACLKAMDLPDNWVEMNGLGLDRAFYRNLGQFLFETRGKFSLVQRVNPFRGPYTSLAWREAMNGYKHESYTLDNWLGTNVVYHFNGEEQRGITELMVFDACDCMELYNLVNAIFDWTPPLPDDFGCFDSNCGIIAYANRHEREFYARKSVPFFNGLI